MAGKARSFSDDAKEANYEKQFGNEVYSAGAQQNSYNLGSVHFSDQSGIANISQAGTDQRKASLQGALYRGNVGFDLQTVELDVPTATIDLNNDATGVVLDVISTDRFVVLSAGTSSELRIITGAQRPGQRLRLYNTLTNTITITHTAAATPDTIRTPDGNSVTFEGNAALDFTYDITTSQWRVVGGPGTGGGVGDTGTYTTADMDQDQLVNLAGNQHIQINQVIEDGGIVLQGQTPTFNQTSGIFELKEGKTYYLSAFIVGEVNAATDFAGISWYDITNATEISRRTALEPMNKAQTLTCNGAIQTIYTPTTDVTVELRIVSLIGALTAIFQRATQCSIFEFSGKNGADGPGGSTAWKTPARAKTLVDVPDLANFDVITDGVTLVEDDRVLLTEQVTQSENGLWQVGVVAGGLAPLTRPVDFDTDAEVIAETFVAIEEGSTSAGTLWHLVSNNPLTIDVSVQVWSQFAPGTSGGPDMGGGEDGVDNAGEFVNDGRVAVGASILKIWEKIEFPANTDPNNSRSNLIYMPSQNNPSVPARILYNALSNNTRGGAYSDDYGETWTLSASLSSNNGYGRMAYAPNLTTNGTLTIIRSQPGFGFSQFKMQYSQDRGLSFTTTVMPNNGQDFVDQVWVESLGLFVATCAGVTTNPAQAVYTSPDGITWTARVTPPPTNALADWHRIVWSETNSLFYLKSNASGVNGDHITSPDGINWSGPFSNDNPVAIPRRIIWSEGQQKFGAAGSSGGIQFSDDFVTWTTNTPADMSNGSDIVWAPDLSLWVVIGANTTNNFINPMIWASNDSVNWATYPKNNFRTVPTSISNVRVQIVYSEEFQYFFGMNSGFGTTQQQFYRTGQRR